eukprot:TRINITY_DN10836_c0_g1_i1.p1 TRINITY_DN10836_c0_g1~~TRINITY_DN10836_c0_g1_i1.p1  ORF type:complete len:747 (+),score=140.44 TRINITY_DN10836_c0_g1_i1:155-2395(+)
MSSTPRDGSESESASVSEELVRTHYGGWVYHLGVNSIGHQFCHLRYMLIKGKYVEMYKRNPSEHPHQKPIRRGVASQFMMLEDMGLRKVNAGDLYILRIYNRLDETKKGEIACRTAAEVKNWMEAFEHAKQEAILDFGKPSGRRMFNNENEFKLDGHRPHVRKYAHGLRKLITIGGGPEMLIRQSSDLGKVSEKNTYCEDTEGDAMDQHQWKCIHTVNSIRILEDVSNNMAGKFVLMKSVGVVDASPDAVFEMVISLDKSKRYEWDMLTSDVELVERIDGHNDIVYGTFDPKYLSRWRSKRDFSFSRYWHRDQDGTYTILIRPTKLKPWPKKSGYEHIELNPCVWEIRKASERHGKTNSKSIVTQTMEIHSTGWGQWRKRYYAKFEKTIPYVLLCQVAGLREYFGANPGLNLDPSVLTVDTDLKKNSDVSGEFEEAETNEEFYDALAAESQMEDEDSEDDDTPSKDGAVKLKNVAWAILSMTSMKHTGEDENTELLMKAPIVDIDPKEFSGSLRRLVSESDSNCWDDPGGSGFMVRSKTYLKDYTKVPGGDPILRLLAVDWLTSDNKIEKVALHPKCIVQTEAGKKLPFILVVNLQVPSKPKYSTVFYFGANSPIKKGSLLDKFANGSDLFRDERFKLIPSIKEGYWMVKRAVGTKACLLGKAVSCQYLRNDNFLEIDVDIGSSSVASSIIGLVLGYVTNLVVDLAILIEAKEESELPEYLLGTVRINRIKLESAQPYEDHGAQDQ